MFAVYAFYQESHVETSLTPWLSHSFLASCKALFFNPFSSCFYFAHLCIPTLFYLGPLDSTVASCLIHFATYDVEFQLCFSSIQLLLSQRDVSGFCHDFLARGIKSKVNFSPEEGRRLMGFHSGLQPPLSYGIQSSITP